MEKEESGGLVAIGEMAELRGISVRTLRYYEEVGLLESVRPVDRVTRAYRPCDQRRLDQILALRRLGLSIKEIQRVFSRNELSELLVVLEHKVKALDGDIGELRRMRAAVEEFLTSVRGLVSSGGDGKALLGSVEKLESALSVPVPDEGSDNPPRSSIRLPDLRVVHLPPCTMVSSGPGTFGDENFDRFDRWFSQFPPAHLRWGIPQDFAWYDSSNGKSFWWYVLPEEPVDTEGFSLVPFSGGFYACAVSRDGDDQDGSRVYEGIQQWIEDSGTLQVDEGLDRHTMFHVVTSPEIREILGFHQLEIFVPLKNEVNP